MKNLFADIYLDDITFMTTELLQKNGIKGVILDIDNTLVGHNVPIPDERILSHLRELENSGIKLCVVSNNKPHRVEAFCEKIGVKYFVADALKPKKRGYEAAASEMGLSMSEIAGIGDQVFTDVWGAKRAGCLAILTKPLHKGGEGAFIALKRLIERPFIMR